MTTAQDLLQDKVKSPCHVICDIHWERDYEMRIEPHKEKIYKLDPHLDKCGMAYLGIRKHCKEAFALYSLYE
jgi:hypothetical protein